MGNNLTFYLHDEETFIPSHTRKFLADIRKQVNTDAEDPTEEREKWENVVGACLYLASNLRCQLFSNNDVQFDDDKEVWSPPRIATVKDGLHALFLIYTAKGMPVPVLLGLRHVNREMEQRGLPKNVYDDMNVHDVELAGKMNDWLVEELELKTTLALGHNYPSMQERATKAAKMFRHVSVKWVKSKHNDGFTLGVVNNLLRSAASILIPANAVGGQFWDILREPNLFYKHYKNLSGGKDWEREERGMHDVTAALAAAVFCNILLSEGEHIQFDPLFETQIDEDNELMMDPNEHGRA